MCLANFKTLTMANPETLTIVEKDAPEDDLEVAPLKLMDNAEGSQ